MVLSEKLKGTADPLYQLFEIHLFRKSYEDASAFAKDVASAYLAYLDASPAHVPIHLRTTVLEDLEQETHEMLVRRMYGCARPIEKNFGCVGEIKGTRDTVSFHTFYPPDSPAVPKK